MNRKCKCCKKERNSFYEFAKKNSKVCVHCNDKGMNDSNYKDIILGGMNEPKILKQVRSYGGKGFQFKKEIEK